MCRRTERIAAGVSADTFRPSVAPDLDGGQAPRGLLTLGIQPNGTVRTEAGHLVGLTPVVKKPMDAGEHVLWLTTEDATREKKVRITIEPGQHAVYRFMLREEDEVPEARRQLDPAVILKRAREAEREKAEHLAKEKKKKEKKDSLRKGN